LKTSGFSRVNINNLLKKLLTFDLAFRYPLRLIRRTHLLHRNEDYRGKNINTLMYNLFLQQVRRGLTQRIDLVSNSQIPRVPPPCRGHFVGPVGLCSCYKFNELIAGYRSLPYSFTTKYGADPHPSISSFSFRIAILIRFKKRANNGIFNQFHLLVQKHQFQLQKLVQISKYK